IAAKDIPPHIMVSTEKPWIDEVLSVGSWDDKWERTLKIGFGRVRERTVHQRLIGLSPYYAQTFMRNYPWQCLYLTRELGPVQVRNLLSYNPAFDLGPKVAPADRSERRLHFARFMMQCGWDDEALQELDRLEGEKPGPDVMADVEKLRTDIRHFQNRDLLETIKRLHNAGQFDKVRKKLADFDEKNADPDVVGKWNELRDLYKTADKTTADATRFLTDLPKGLGNNARDAALAEASAALLAELQPDVLPKLDAFLGQARQAERQRGACLTPAMGPDQLLALAVTGWLGALPDPTPERAVRLWRARQFVQKYLAAAPGAREGLLSAYQSDRDGAATLDEIKAIIPLLPPPEPEPLDGLVDKTVERTCGAANASVKYLLHLPPEYRHSRNCPVLFVLHQGGETPQEMLDRWSDAAGLNGYILVAPEWSQNSRTVYGYSEREHATALETLRDLRQHFAVDSDRVFLFGCGQGGAMAFDVGLSHPDLFAGVLPMSAYPENFTRVYSRNAEYLPFYIVDGDRSGDVHQHNMREQFDDWVNKYPVLWLQYKGRGVEWFGGEVPTMFDWMRGKKRQFPLQQLGGAGGDGSYFTSERTTDNAFYWLTTDDIEARRINSEVRWMAAVAPARISGRIDLDNNGVYVDTTGVKQVTVWLGANGDGVDMVRFDKPLTVHWIHGGSSELVWNNKTVTRSLATLMEDLARRGDRQRLFTAKLEFSTK
ncbi:MAG TPA: hypothetical protein VMS17_03090, partial [Gemmataceae bacterium]|nr:hypothetical protein [Gemmataceae bacterium]